ncbi:YceI family protein [Planosporangium mesophilum]|uniref:YceI family protein n=1 Tax=Planosporangium mesophilum TaxID=689768 RepID=UPI00194F0498|nr:YceI family protein [Planosporangium mesophilum]
MSAVERATPSAANGAPTPDRAHRVRGVVSTVDGWPLPGAAVTVVGATGAQLGRGAADEAGAFSVAVAAAGPATFICAAPGVDPVARSITVSGRGATDVGVVLMDSPRRTALPEPGVWVLDPAHSIVRAKARHLALSHVEGRFMAFSGEVRVADPVEASTVEVTIEAASIDTGNADRDAHLRSPDFLDVERFPVLRYRGERVVRQDEDRWRVEGFLTIRDVTRPVALEATYLGSGSDPWGGQRIALVASTQLARRDYEMNWNMGLPGGLVVVGPTLRIDLEIQAVRQVEDAVST